MSRLLVRPGPPKGDARVLLDVPPERAGWERVGFSVVRLGEGERHRLDTGRRELCAVVLGGRCRVTVGGDRGSGADAPATWDIGERASPFDGPPGAFYAPPGSEVLMEAAGPGAEVAFGTAPALRGAAPRPLHPADARREVRGSGNMERTIHHILMEDGDAESLLVTEVLTPAGNWSSYPPHKHDTDDPPHETALEETYYHRLRDTRGFAVQHVYTPDRSLDEAVAVRDGDLVLVPRGYHTVSAAPGYELYYLNVMAGPVRRWCVSFDPDHIRLRGA